MDKEEIIDIPAYAKLGKKNTVYVLKKDLEYFNNTKETIGYFVIGAKADIPGKMIPNYNYYRYCTEEALKEKEQREAEEKRRLEEEARREKEAEEERKRNLGWAYIPLQKTWPDMNCFPVNGYLAERFFSETGLDQILNDVLSRERSFWMRLTAVLNAVLDHQSFQFDGLDNFPMKDHMVYELDYYFTLHMWSMITEKEINEILSKWLKKQSPKNTSALLVKDTVSLYHDGYSDNYGDSFFGQRLRTGTRYDEKHLLYRDKDTGILLAYEPLNLKMPDYDFQKDMYEIYTIRNSRFEELKNASLSFYMEPYTYKAERAVWQIPMTFGMRTSDYENQKEIKAKIKELDQQPVVNKRKIIRWDGHLDKTQGHWVLIEYPEKREWIVNEAKDFLTRQKRRLQQMSYYRAVSDPYANYYEIEQDPNDDPIADLPPYSVKFVHGAVNLLKQDAGLYLYFSTEEEISDMQWIERQWHEDDIEYMYSAFINHGQTTDAVDEFFGAMKGRDLTLFLAQMYREWIYAHIGDQFTEEFEIAQFAEMASEWECRIEHDGTVHPDKMKKKLVDLLKRFNIEEAEIVEYIRRNAANPKYFSDQYEY